MAIDTMDKRASILGLKLAWLSPLPIPDGTISAADRGDVLGEFSGSFTPDVASTGTGVRRWRMGGIARANRRRKRRR